MLSLSDVIALMFYVAPLEVKASIASILMALVLFEIMSLEYLLLCIIQSCAVFRP